MRTVDSLSEEERKEYFGFLLMAKFCEKADPSWLDKETHLPIKDMYPQEYKAKANAILSKE